MKKLKAKDLKPSTRVLKKSDLKHIVGAKVGAQDDATINVSHDTGCSIGVCACRCN